MNRNLQSILFYNSHQYQVSYLEIPKCGCTSIKSAMPDAQITGAPFYESFTVLRNPIDRIESAYCELIRSRKFSGSFGDLMRKIKVDGFFDKHLIPQKQYYQPVQNTFIFPDFKSVGILMGVPLKKLNERISDCKVEWHHNFYEIYTDEITFFDKMISIQEQFFAMYSKEASRPDQLRFVKTVFQWEQQFGMAAPYKSYNSFKNAHGNFVKSLKKVQ